MKPARFRSAPASSPVLAGGFGIVEPIVLTAILMLVLVSTVSVFNTVNRRTLSTQQQVVMQASIDDNLRQIKTLARQFTCCSGVCTTTPPTTFGVVSGVTQACATNNPMDDRYYFPQVDLTTTTANFPNTTTPSEPLAVEQLCSVANNNNFMTPFRNAVNALPQPPNATRATAIQAERVLRVTFTDNNNANRVVRVENIIPHMSYYCP
jgi:type II secretory pathway pseudopilin PulG